MKLLQKCTKCGKVFHKEDLHKFTNADILKPSEFFCNGCYYKGIDHKKKINVRDYNTDKNEDFKDER